MILLTGLPPSDLATIILQKPRVNASMAQRLHTLTSAGIAGFSEGCDLSLHCRTCPGGGGRLTHQSLNRLVSHGQLGRKVTND